MMYALRRRSLPSAWIGAIVALAGAFCAGGAAADTVKVQVDKSHIMRLPDRTATVVIGNPLIADATLQGGGLLVVTGKGYGATNLVALDRAGRALKSDTIEVVGPGTADIVTVYRGADRETYSCSPLCEARATLGDAPAFFTATLGQIGVRNGQAAPPAK